MRFSNTEDKLLISWTGWDPGNYILLMVKGRAVSVDSVKKRTGSLRHWLSLGLGKREFKQDQKELLAFRMLIATQSKDLPGFEGPDWQLWPTEQSLSDPSFRRLIPTTKYVTKAGHQIT